jgi:hypothetical protein
MKDIQKRELSRAIDLIKGLGCTYRILTPDGESFGDLQIVEPKTRQRSPSKYPHGSLTKQVKTHMDLNAEIGVVQEVPCGEFDLEMLRSVACSILTSVWGKDSYVTMTRGNCFEVMRTAKLSTEEVV